MASKQLSLTNTKSDQSPLAMVRVAKPEDSPQSSAVVNNNLFTADPAVVDENFLLVPLDKPATGNGVGGQLSCSNIHLRSSSQLLPSMQMKSDSGSKCMQQHNAQSHRVRAESAESAAVVTAKRKHMWYHGPGCGQIERAICVPRSAPPGVDRIMAKVGMQSLHLGPAEVPSLVASKDGE